MGHRLGRVAARIAAVGAVALLAATLVAPVALAVFAGIVRSVAHPRG